MPPSNKQIQETPTQQLPTISSTTQPLPTEKTVKICWNTGEEKNCPACYLNKGCKAKT